MEDESVRSIQSVDFTIFDILSSFTRTNWGSTSIASVRSFKHQRPATVPAPSPSVLHFLFFSLMAGLFSVGLVSKMSVLDVLSSRQEVTVFDKQSDSVDVSAQRE